MSREGFQVENNKESCLLCLSENNNEDETNKLSTAFKMLLRYLKIDSGSSFNIASLPLCGQCSTVMTTFLQSFQEFEIIRIKLDNCAQKLHQRMEEAERKRKSLPVLQANRNGQRKKRSSGSTPSCQRFPVGAPNGNVAEDLRKEIFEKCGRRLTSSLPRIPILDSGRPENIPKILGTYSCANIGFSSEDQELCTNDNHPDFLLSRPTLEDPLKMDDGTDDDPNFEEPPTKRERTSKCLECGLSFTSLNNLGTHRREVHLGIKKLQCNHCDKKFKRTEHLRQHASTFHTFQLFQRKFPPGTTEEEFGSVVHKLTLAQFKTCSSGVEGSNITKSYKCSLCESLLKAPDTKKGHICKYHVAEICEELERMKKVIFKPENVESKAELEDPLKLSAVAEGSSLEKYNSRYADWLGIQSHRMKLPDGKCKCRICSKIMEYSSFTRHYKQVHGSTFYNCVYCDKKYHRSDHLSIHVTGSHPLLEFADQLPLNTTESELRKATQLLKEERLKTRNLSAAYVHTFIPSYECPVCEKRCRNGYYKNVHLFKSHLDQIILALGRLTREKDTSEGKVLAEEVEETFVIKLEKV